MSTKLSETHSPTTMIKSQSWSRATTLLALIAIVGIADYLLNLVALHFLRPDVNLVLEPISNYAAGPYGFLLTAASIGSGLAALALMVGLYLGIAPPARSYVGLFSLGLYGVSVLLAGVFPIDLGAETTMNGIIHNIVGNLSFFSFPIAVILLSLGMGKDERWRSMRLPALALSGVVVLTVVLTMVGFNLGIGFGVTQRLANVAVLLWMVVVALRLRSIAHNALVLQPRVV